ncbi:MAG: TetR/AcrR family transcriptional regulator [Alphaproteobacteria bacterium]|nr:TetR/AcrR family transcriptional regulator [Alphaproteobacteria bacterium]
MRKTKTQTRTAYHHGDLRAALLDAAEIELTKKGVEAFSLRGVAKRAGVSHAAPAHHFSDARGLLTALAAIGYERFIETQKRRQHDASPDPKAQLAALGLGYVDFAMANPALFRLMFSSEKTNKTNEALATASSAAFDKLVVEIQNITKSDPYTDPIAMTDVMAVWAIVHGLADLMIAGRTRRITFLENLNKEEREAILSDIILRASTVQASE